MDEGGQAERAEQLTVFTQTAWTGFSGMPSTWPGAAQEASDLGHEVQRHHAYHALLGRTVPGHCRGVPGRSDRSVPCGHSVPPTSSSIRTGSMWWWAATCSGISSRTWVRLLPAPSALPRRRTSIRNGSTHPCSSPFTGRLRISWEGRGQSHRADLVRGHDVEAPGRRRRRPGQWSGLSRRFFRSRAFGPGTWVEPLPPRSLERPWPKWSGKSEEADLCTEIDVNTFRSS